MSSVPPQLRESRHAHVRSAMEAASVDALLVIHLPDIFYLTGFAGTAAAVIVTRDGLYFVTDARYTTAAQALLQEMGGAGTELVTVEHTYDETLVALIRRLGSRRIGFDAGHMTVARLSWLSAAMPAAVAGPDASGQTPTDTTAVLVPLESAVTQARIRKDAHEIGILREAGRLLSMVAREQLEHVHAGQLEREIAADLEWAMKRAGFSRPAFDSIVASGPQSALPHARPTSRVLQSGDLVVLDFGGVYDGYCVDLTRTVCIGAPDAETCRMYDAVRAAQAAAIAAAAPGMPASAIDTAARQTLERFGLADRFTHGTGHGLGIEVHEAPRISRRRELPSGARDSQDVPIEIGMVFTVEPGVYVPGFGGVRIEDDVLLTAGGCELLTDVSRELLIR